jgi:hypothetical protein
MPAVLKKLEDEALKLPARSHARLAERLLASLNEEPADPDAEKLWGGRSKPACGRARPAARSKDTPVDKVLRRARAALRAGR